MVKIFELVLLSSDMEMKEANLESERYPDFGLCGVDSLHVLRWRPSCFPQVEPKGLNFELATW